MMRSDYMYLYIYIFYSRHYPPSSSPYLSYTPYLIRNVFPPFSLFGSFLGILLRVRSIPSWRSPHEAALTRSELIFNCYEFESELSAKNIKLVELELHRPFLRSEFRQYSFVQNHNRICTRSRIQIHGAICD